MIGFYVCEAGAYFTVCNTEESGSLRRLLFLIWSNPGQQVQDVDAQGLSKLFQATHRDVGHATFQLRNIGPVEIRQFGHFLLAQPPFLPEPSHILRNAAAGISNCRFFFVHSGQRLTLYGV